jgi:hypothetical protein
MGCTVSFAAAQASLTSWSEARMSTIRDVMMVRNTGCRNSRRIPGPINRSFSAERNAPEGEIKPVRDSGTPDSMRQAEFARAQNPARCATATQTLPRQIKLAEGKKFLAQILLTVIC